MNLIDTRTALFVAGLPSPLSQLWKRVAAWIVEICASDEDCVDPTSQFSLHDWADMPTHHPASDE